MTLHGTPLFGCFCPTHLDESLRPFSKCPMSPKSPLRETFGATYTIQLRSGARTPIQQLNDDVSLVRAYFTEHTSIQLQHRCKGTLTTPVACQQCHLSPLPCHRRNLFPSVSRGPGRLITVNYASPGAQREQDSRLFRCCVRQDLPHWNERCPHRNRVHLIGYTWDASAVNGSQMYFCLDLTYCEVIERFALPAPHRVLSLLTLFPSVGFI